MFRHLFLIKECLSTRSSSKISDNIMFVQYVAVAAIVETVEYANYIDMHKI